MEPILDCCAGMRQQIQVTGGFQKDGEAGARKPHQTQPNAIPISTDSPPAPMPQPTPPAKVVSMSPKWTERQSKLLQAAWKPCLCAEAEGCAGGCNPPSFADHIISRKPPYTPKPPPTPPAPTTIHNDCYWKGFIEDDDAAPQDQFEGEVSKETSGPSDRNFDGFAPTKRQRQNRERRERRRQARASKV